MIRVDDVIMCAFLILQKRNMVEVCEEKDAF